MARRPPSSAVVVLVLAGVLTASVLGGWLAASRLSADDQVVLVAPDPSEPTYDAGDPAEPPPVPAVQAVPVAQPPSTVPPRPAAADPATPAPADPAPPADEPTGTDAGPASAPDPRPATTAPDVPAPPERPEPPDPTVTPYTPPPAIGIAAEALPAEGEAWSRLLAARRAAPAGSQERRDIDWLVSFARTAAAPGRPEGRRATARRALRVNAWWFGRRGSPDQRVIARDPDGVILTYKRGHGFMVNPVATMGRWRGLNELWSPAQLAEAMLPMLVERVHDGREWAALEYFDVPGDRDAVQPGVSGMGQARAASLFARAHDDTGDPRFLAAAERVLRSFSVPVDRGGVLAQVPDPAGGAPGPWYPERAYPGRPAWTGAALNGFMVTLIELRRASRWLDGGGAPAAAEQAPGAASTTPAGAEPPPTPTDGSAPTAPAPVAEPPAGGTADPAARSAAARTALGLAARGERSLARFLSLHDTGEWSYYGLLTPGKPWRTYLADLNYHCYHVSLLRSLHSLYPEGDYAAVATRWQGYVDAKGVTCPAR